MTYGKTTWIDEVTPISAANMNKIEQGIADAHANYTAADVLAKLVTVDGNGSGLDADTVKGYVPLNASGGELTGEIFIRNGTADTPDVTFQDPVNNTRVSMDMSFEQFRVYSSYRGGPTKFPLQLTLSNETAAIFGQQVWTTGWLRNNAGVLEYNDGGTWKAAGGVKSIQRGTVSVANGITNVSIGSVNTAKSSLKIDTILTQTTSGTNRTVINASFTGATNIAFNSTDSGTALLTWEVIEYH